MPLALLACQGGATDKEPGDDSAAESDDSTPAEGDCVALTAHASASRGAGRLPFAPTLDGSASCGPDPISAWRWSVGGQTLSGAQVTWTGLSAGEVTATLTVEDVFGNTASTQLTLTVHPQECPEVLPDLTLGTVADSSLVEASGLVVSGRDPELLWSHNDSGHTASLFAMARDGRALGTWTLPVETGDWEDIARGVDPDTGAPLLLIGDIGNNDATREALLVYVLEEPTVDLSAEAADHAVASFRTLTLRLPEPLSADTLLWDPISGDLYVLSDDNAGRTVILRKPAPHLDGDDVLLESVGELQFGGDALPGDALLTAGDVSPLGERVVLRTRGEAWLWLRDGAQSVAEALAAAPCPVPLPSEPLGEAIAFDTRDGGVLITSEGVNQPILRVPFYEPPECYDTLDAVITATPPGGPLPLEVVFDASGSCAPAGVAEARWDIDGAVLYGESVSASWLASGSYPVTLTLTDTLGAVDSESTTIVVEPGECPVSSGAETTGTVLDAALIEVSGVVVSRLNESVLWVHNDSGDTPRIFAIDRAGNTLGTWTFDTSRGDIEDIAAGYSEAGVPELWIGNIGDNAEARADIAIYRIDEPAMTDPEPIDHTVTEFDTITLSYPDGARNCETLMVDPLTRDIYLVTKDYDGLSDVYRKHAPHTDGETAVLEHVTSLVFGEGDLAGGKPTTAGEFSHDGAWIVVRTYNSTAYIWRRDQSGTVDDAFATTPCPITLPSEPQGEAICFDASDDALLSISEQANQPIYRVPLQAAAR